MRILFCSGFPVKIEREIKGGGNWIVQHIRALSKYAAQDIQLSVVCIDSWVKEFKYREKDGIHYNYIPSFKGTKANRTLYSLGLIEVYKDLIDDVKQAIDHFQPDIIQIFGLNRNS